MNALTTIDAVPPGALTSYEQQEAESVRRYQAAEKAASTRRAYRSDIKAFSLWCLQRGLDPMPAKPNTVCRFLSHGADNGLSASSLGRRIAAIAYMHALKEVESPTASKQVKVTLAGIRNEIGAAPTRRKTPATADLIQRLLDACPDDTPIGLRDRALIAFGFAGAFRRSELAALMVQDLEETPDMFKVTVRRSKTNQAQLGAVVPVPRGYKLRPVRAVQTWLQAAQIHSGHLLRQVHRSGAVRAAGLSGAAIAGVVQQRAKQAGLDPREFAGHSLRSGFLTSSAEAGDSIFKMMVVSRHRSMDTLSGYVRSAELFHKPAGASFL